MAAWPEGVDRVVLQEVDSTNSEAARRAASVLQPTWIMAHRQTSGRGRRGRFWISPAGNLAATLLMRPECDPERAALYSFVAALSVAEALEQLTEAGPAISLKWPNDVLLNGGKVAGILLESSGRGGGVGHLMIGIGVNLIAAPPPEAVEPGAVPPVSVLAETGIRIMPDSFLTALARAFDRHDRQLRNYGFDPIRTAWLARAARLGQPITARLPNETLSGTFETISDNGALVLATAQGRRHIPAADIYF